MRREFPRYGSRRKKAKYLALAIVEFLRKLDVRMKKTDKPQTSHKFAELPAFDRAMRKLAQVPKEDVEKREKASRTPRMTNERE